MLRLLFVLFSVLVSSVSAADWVLLHSEQDKNTAEIFNTQDITTFNLALQENGAVNFGYQEKRVDGKPVFPLVIEDLKIAVSVKSDKKGFAAGVQIVLPNSIHPQTKLPVTFLAAGKKYSGSKYWETLNFPDLYKEMHRIAGNLQSELKTHLDLRGAYVRQIVFYAERLQDDGTEQVAAGQMTAIKIAEVKRPVLTGVAEISAEQTESLPFSTVFDPINYAGFKVNVTAKPTYLTQVVNKNTEWISPLENQKTAPLIANTRIKVGLYKALTDSGHFHLTAAAGSLDGSGNPVPTAASSVELYSAASPAVLSPAAASSPLAESPPSMFPSAASPSSVPPSGVSSSGGHSSTTELTRIRLSDGTLTIDDVPVGVRAVEYRGEPLDFLRKLEFNAVWLKEVPSAELRLEAQRAGLWLVCPPPSSAELETAKTFDNRPQTHRTATLDSSYDNILAWNLGDECSNARYQADAQRAQVLQNADRTKRRPLLCTARSGIYDYSRTCEILMMPKVPLLSSLDMLDLSRWQRSYPSLARPDTSFWAAVQTQPPVKLSEQWTAFEGSPPYICALSYEQIKMQIYSALAAGCRGVLFTSETSLTNDDPETEFRRTALELANWELQLAEEWFAAGRSLNTAQSSQKPMCSAVIQSGRSRLLVPMLQERLCQNAVGPAVSGNVRYVISGIPETYNAYHLVPGRLMPIEAKRVAGGMQIELEEANLNSLIFFGEDDAVYAQVGQRAKLMGARAAYLACHLAELQLASAEQVFGSLKRLKETNSIPIRPEDNLPLVPLPEQESMLRTTREALDFAKTLVSRTPPDFARAYLQAERSTRGLRFTAKDLWQEAMRHEVNACMTPVSVSFATLPMYMTFYQRMAGGKLGANRLIGGDMEMPTLEQAGWEPMSHRIEGARAAGKDIVAAARHSGQSGLRLVVVPSEKGVFPSVLETVPLWTATPPVTVRSGEVLCVTGWIRIPQKLESTVDGLMIFDSFGGEELSLRFIETNGDWRNFVFYRIAPTDGNFYVFFALNGCGEVHLDDIQVSAVQFAGTESRPVQGAEVPKEPVPYWRRLNPLQYLPNMPAVPNRNRERRQ
ncbi:MAG: hypothetical protein LBT46_10425 [Planctomycetaceae bacterium]|jgi:hypothetical protein|nr:hypothetical protein [Planctomycetaceae bacterium]